MPLHHCTKRAFELFLDLSQDAGSVSVKAGDSIEVSGTVLVWGSATAKGIEAVRNHFGISDVLTVEDCISDLLEWQNQEYQQFLSARAEWVSSMFKGLRTY